MSIRIFLFQSLLHHARKRTICNFSNSEPVPFAFLYVQGGTQTTANEEGSYQLEVPGEMTIAVVPRLLKVSKINLHPRQTHS